MVKEDSRHHEMQFPAIANAVLASVILLVLASVILLVIKIQEGNRHSNKPKSSF
jgi:hypothetical protein